MFLQVPMITVLLIATAYIYGYARIRREGKRIAGWHLISFFFGLVFIGIGLSPSMMNWGHMDLRGHMVQHVLIAMFAPILLILGVPLKILLGSISPIKGRRVVKALKLPILRFVTHPLIALVINVGAMYMLYLTPLYALSLSNPFVHHFIHLHFILAGCLYAWSIIGLEAVPHRPGFKIRCISIVVSIALHAILCKVMYVYSFPVIPFTDTSPARAAAFCNESSSISGSALFANDISMTQEAALIMYYWGDLAELILLIILFLLWHFRKPLWLFTETPQKYVQGSMIRKNVKTS